MSSVTTDASALPAATVDQCSSKLAGWASASPPVVIAAFATALPPQWLLGASAAMFGIPLVVIGLGRPWGGMQNIAQKFYAVRRSAQILRRLVPTAAIIVADAWDTMVVNNVTGATASMLADIGNSRRILVSGECNSWPRCYAEQLAQDSRSARCLTQPGAACFANSGMYAASAAALEDALLPAAMREMVGQVLRLRVCADSSHDPIPPYSTGWASALLASCWHIGMRCGVHLSCHLLGVVYDRYV